MRKNWFIFNTNWIQEKLENEKNKVNSMEFNWEIKKKRIKGENVAIDHASSMREKAHIRSNMER